MSPNLIIHMKYRYGAYRYRMLRSVARRVNVLKPKTVIPSNLATIFLEDRKRTIQMEPQGQRIFSWALHDADGRGQGFQQSNRDHHKTWHRWLDWYKFHHFQWNRPHSRLIRDLQDTILQKGRQTWKNLFIRYWIPELDAHDLYSLPDVYYIMDTLGHCPESVIDIGAGWGRLGMAWIAVGVRVIGITDSIAQPYQLQYQYLTSIPDIHFQEMLNLGSRKDVPDFFRQRGLLHFPLWYLPQIPDHSIEVVSAIQVLREVNIECLRYIFAQIQRVLVHGGIFYVRDNDHQYKEQCMHRIKITDELVERGFEVIRFDHLLQGRDIHGVPRIFRFRR